MSQMATPQPGAGGKIVTSRRKQRLAASSYERPLRQLSPHPPPKSPNWFAGIIVPSARAFASGAGKILSTIFSESESSSSENEDFVLEDGIDNDNGVNTINEENLTSPGMIQYGEESELMWRRETKRIIEQLIMKETFSREECDRLIKILNSRVIDWSMEAGEKSSVACSPAKTDEDVDKAIKEAKRWFREKVANSVKELTRGVCNLNSNPLEHVESGGDSPVDLARFYVEDRPPWVSPWRNVELRTPLTATMKLFKEGTSKKRRSLSSGSWNIQEELRRVRSRATKDMLHTPSTKTDPSLSRVVQIRAESAGAGENVCAMGERVTEPASLRQNFDSRQDGKASEAVSLSTKRATFFSGKSEVLEALLADAEHPVSKLINASSPKHAEEQYAGYYWQRWDEEDKGSNNAERVITLKQERELKRLESSVNYNGRKEKA